MSWSERQFSLYFFLLFLKLLLLARVAAAAAGEWSSIEWRWPEGERERRRMWVWVKITKTTKLKKKKKKRSSLTYHQKKRRKKFSTVEGDLQLRKTRAFLHEVPWRDTCLSERKSFNESFASTTCKDNTTEVISSVILFDLNGNLHSKW